MDIQSDLVIIGAGAAGLFGACCAARSGLHPLLVERRHRSGLKLLISGNNRCNFSRNLSAEQMLDAYGMPQAEFLSPAIHALPPARLREFFRSLGLESTLSGDRIYPESGKADDVLHAMMDCLRDHEIPIVYNCPVNHISRLDEQESWQMDCGHGMKIHAKSILMTIGGFSFPKTGSVGDGLRFSQELHLDFTPAMPGLVASETARGTAWEHAADDRPVEFTDIALTTSSINPIRGNLTLDRALLRGSAIYDLNRAIAHSAGIAPEASYMLTADFFPSTAEKSLDEKLRRFLPRASTIPQLLNALGLTPGQAQAVSQLIHSTPTAFMLKHLPIGSVRRRSLKEAITTAGGFSLDEFNPETMQAKRLPGLFAAGEVLDYDGPTGGFNLHAAFATASLAIASISGKKTLAEPLPPHEKKRPANAQGDRRGKSAPDSKVRPKMRTSATGAHGQKASWGKNFWDGRRLSRQEP